MIFQVIYSAFNQKLLKITENRTKLPKLRDGGKKDNNPISNPNVDAIEKLKTT